mgnify:CR=1 FL=1
MKRDLMEQRVESRAELFFSCLAILAILALVFFC